jgi:hypothetical protein
MNNPDVFAKEKPHVEELLEADYSIILHSEINSGGLLKPSGKLMEIIRYREQSLINWLKMVVMSNNRYGSFLQ